VPGIFSKKVFSTQKKKKKKKKKKKELARIKPQDTWMREKLTNQSI